MPLTAYVPDTIISHGAVFPASALLVESGRVQAIVAKNDVPNKAERVELAGLTLAPGLVDAQVNGGGGDLFNDNPARLHGMAEAHRQSGTTAFLATLISDDLAKIPLAVDAVRAYRRQHPEGPVIGLHLEGPFLNPERKGIHPAAAIRGTGREILQRIQPAELGTLMITLAPEVFEDHELNALAGNGVILAAGHSAVPAARFSSAVQSGLRGVTHLFNGMGGMSARAPGLAGLALLQDDVWCSLICDDAHVDAAMIHLALRTKPEGKLFLVSDAMPPAGQTPPKDFHLLGNSIQAKDGKCLDEHGNLAGSAATLFDCVKIAVQKIGIPLPQALAMASLYPATFLGIETQHGSFRPHAYAHAIAFDAKMNLQAVI